MRVWGQGWVPTDDSVEKEAENYSTTPLMKHIQAGNVFASDTGIAVYKYFSISTLYLRFPDVHLPRKGSIPFSRKWVQILIGNSRGTHTPFGVTMTSDQVLNLISNIPKTHMKIPSTVLQTDMSKEIIISHKKWAVSTVRFQVGNSGLGKFCKLRNTFGQAFVQKMQNKRCLIFLRKDGTPLELTFPNQSGSKNMPCRQRNSPFGMMKLQLCCKWDLCPNYTGTRSHTWSSSSFTCFLSRRKR